MQGLSQWQFSSRCKRIKNKYDSADKLVAAAKRSENSSMESIKKNEKLLREAAKDIGLK